MGAYLSSPVTDKTSENGTTEIFDYGASAMQGWRYYMEDAHNCISNLDDQTAMFGVYDGHGGAEVAIYCAQHLPDFIKNTKSYKAGDLGKGLEEAFMEFDATLTQTDIIRELRQISGTMQEPDAADNDDEETTKLTEEATLPLTELLAKYGYQLKEQANTKALRKKVNQEDLLSPVIRKSQSRLNPLSKEALASGKDSDKDTESSGQKTKDQISEESNHKQTHTEESDSKQTKSDCDQSDVADSEAKKCNGKTALSGNGDANGVSTGSKESAEKPEEIVAGQSGLGNGDAVEEDEEEDDDDDYKDENEDKDEDDESEESDDDEDDDDEDDDDDDEDEGCGDEEEEEESGGAVKGIMGLSDKEEPGSDSGCTATVALMRGNQLIVANAGDSRCIVSRSGKAIDMSLDHKPEDEPERLRIEKAGGKVTSDGRVNGGLNLSRAIGDHCYKQNKELAADEQMISAFPDIQTITLTPEDEFIVVACDGIWNVLSSQETIDFVKERMGKEGVTLSSICEEMFDHCLAPDSMGDGTGCDNMTCIIVKLKHTPQDSKQSDTSGKRPASPDSLSSASPAKRVKN